MPITQTEPVALGGAFIALATAADGALNGFGIVHWTNVQNGLVLALFSAATVAIHAVVRSRVTPISAPSIAVPLSKPDGSAWNATPDSAA